MSALDWFTENIVEPAQDSAGDLVEAGDEFFSDTAESAEEFIEDSVQSGEELIEDFARSGEEFAESVSEGDLLGAVGGLGESIGEAFSEFGESMGEAFFEFGESMGEASSEFSEATTIVFEELFLRLAVAGEEFTDCILISDNLVHFLFESGDPYDSECGVNALTANIGETNSNICLHENDILAQNTYDYFGNYDCFTYYQYRINHGRIICRLKEFTESCEEIDWSDWRTIPSPNTMRTFEAVRNIWCYLPEEEVRRMLLFEPIDEDLNVLRIAGDGNRIFCETDEGRLFFTSIVNEQPYPMVRNAYLKHGQLPEISDVWTELPTRGINQPIHRIAVGYWRDKITNYHVLDDDGLVKQLDEWYDPFGPNRYGWKHGCEWQPVVYEDAIIEPHTAVELVDLARQCKCIMRATKECIAIATPETIYWIRWSYHWAPEEYVHDDWEFDVRIWTPEIDGWRATRNILEWDGSFLFRTTAGFAPEHPNWPGVVARREFDVEFFVNKSDGVRYKKTVTWDGTTSEWEPG